MNSMGTTDSVDGKSFFGTGNDLDYKRENATLSSASRFIRLGGPHIFRHEARKVLEDFFDGIALGKARQQGPQRNARALKHRLPAANLRVADDSLRLLSRAHRSVAPMPALILPRAISPRFGTPNPPRPNTPRQP